MGNEIGAYFKVAKTIGYAGCIATGINSYIMIKNCNFDTFQGRLAAAKATLDFGMSIFGALGGPLGFAISTTYFILDVATDGFGIQNQ